MTKNPTQYRPDNTGDMTSANEGYFLLLETSDKVLQEGGDDILLEPNVAVAKSPRTYTDE